MSAIEVLKLLRDVLGWAIRHLPDTELRGHLSETARQIDDAIADAAEDIKFGS
jgi:hypothetical protein